MVLFQFSISNPLQQIVQSSEMDQFHSSHMSIIIYPTRARGRASIVFNGTLSTAACFSQRLLTAASPHGIRTRCRYSSLFLSFRERRTVSPHHQNFRHVFCLNPASFLDELILRSALFGPLADRHSSLARCSRPARLRLRDARRLPRANRPRDPRGQTSLRRDGSLLVLSQRVPTGHWRVRSFPLSSVFCVQIDFCIHCERHYGVQWEQNGI